MRARGARFWRATAVLLVIGLVATGWAVEPLAGLTAVRGLSREEAAKGLPVSVRGVVTWRDQGGQLTVQDGDAGSWILVLEARKRGVLVTDDAIVRGIHVGHVLEIEGITTPGGFAPDIIPRVIRVVGEEPLPAPRPMVPGRFLRGADAGLRVEARGIVQGFRSASSSWILNLDANPGHFTVEFPHDALADPESLVDAEVRVTGLATSRINTRGEITLSRIYSSQTSELLIEKPATPAFSAPLVPLDQLVPFRPEPKGPHRLRVIGTVTYALPGRLLYLQEGDAAVRVETRTDTAFQAGDRVEAAGFVEMSRNVGMLSGAVVRKIGTAPVPAAVAITPEEIIALNLAALNSGKMAQPHDYDGHLVRFPAKLLAVLSPPDVRQSWRRLTLDRGGVVLSALLQAGATEALDALVPGSELEVTGIVQLEYTSVEAPRLSLAPTRLDVVLRSVSDVTVLRAPSWWTPARLLAVTAIVAVGFGAALIWVWLLRRQVRLKSKQLATEISARRDAAVEFQATLRERNRLAANLHDTLLQTLGGIGFQLGACEAEAKLPDRDGKPLQHLGVTRRILEHATKELRQSVWELRSPPLQGKGLVEALRALVEQAGVGLSVRIELSADDDLPHVSEFVAGNLVLTAKEALHNAVKHGSPNSIRVEARHASRPDWILIRIHDDGSGFTPGTEAGANQGHFGLVGMRERIERLEGRWWIESAPGQGTTVSFEVPARSYDETVARLA